MYLSGGITDGPDIVEKFYEDRRIKLEAHICHHFHGKDGVNPTSTEFLDDHILKSSESLQSLARLIKDKLQFNADHRLSTPVITLQLFWLSQRSIFREMRTALDVHIDSMDLKLEIMLERLNIWAQIVGLDFDPPDISISAWFATPHSLEEYVKLERILGQCAAEIDFIATRLDRKGKETYPTFGHLKGFQDDLWDMQSSSVRARK